MRNTMSSIKQRLIGRRPLIGVFLKTPSPIIVEVLAKTALHCVCLDAEHAPFDRRDLDLAIMAGRAHHLPILVRTPSARAEHILNALDCGADGVLIPHIRTTEDAALAVRLSHYGAGGRGYAGSSRAAGYTTLSMAEHRRQSAERTTVILQIEDPEAVEGIEDIAAVPGIDALFIGRADLAAAYQVDGPSDARVTASAERVCAAAMAAKVPVGVFIADIEEAPRWATQGATFFLYGSDHSFLLSGARALMSAADRLFEVSA